MPTLFGEARFNVDSVVPIESPIGVTLVDDGQQSILAIPPTPVAGSSGSSAQSVELITPETSPETRAQDTLPEDLLSYKIEELQLDTEGGDLEESINAELTNVEKSSLFQPVDVVLSS